MDELERRLRAHVVALATVPRPPGSAAHTAARAYIRDHLSAAGLVVHDDPFPGGINLLTEPLGPAEGPLVIVGAHYDSLPETPGADDNASAVAALLELAAALPPDPANWTARLQLAAYDLEEYGLRGSKHHSGRVGQSVRVMVSLEMLGYTDPRPGVQKLPRGLTGRYPDTGDFIAAVGNTVSTALTNQVTAALARVPGLPAQALVVPGDGSFLPETRRSDHASFWDARLPALMVTDTSFLRNPHYHLASDTPDTLDYAFLTRVTLGVRLVVAELLTMP